MELQTSSNRTTFNLDSQESLSRKLHNTVPCTYKYNTFLHYNYRVFTKGLFRVFYVSICSYAGTPACSNDRISCEDGALHQRTESVYGGKKKLLTWTVSCRCKEISQHFNARDTPSWNWYKDLNYWVCAAYSERCYWKQTPHGMCACVRAGGWDFDKTWYLTLFRKSVEKIQISLKSDKNNGYFTWRHFDISDDTSLNSC